MSDKAIREALGVTQDELIRLGASLRSKLGLADGASLREALAQEPVPPPPPPSKSILDTAVRHQVYLEQVASGLAEPLQDAVQKVIDNAAKLLSEQGMDVKDMTPAQIKKLVEATKEEQTQILLDNINEDLSPKLVELADYEAEFNPRAMGANTRKVRVRSAKAGEVYAEALKQPIAATGDLMKPYVEDWAKKEVANVGAMIAKGYAHGWTNQQMIQALRGTQAAKYKDGLVPRARKNADAIVRTTVQHIANTARDLTWAKNADLIEAERVVATLDGNTTPQCRSLDGREFPLGKGPKFPLHVRCRTTKVAVLKDEYAALSEGRTRSAEFGPVSAKQTYYDWLGDQDETFQVGVLGKERAKLFRDGGLTADEFARLNLGRNFQPRTLAEMRKLEAGAFEKAGL